jgi:hypothetical protein
MARSSSTRRKARRNNFLPRLEAFIPDEAILTGLRKAILNEPRNTRFLHLSILQIGNLEELNDEQFRKVLRFSEKAGFTPLPDYLTIPQRAAVRFGGIEKVPAHTLADIDLEDVLEFPDYRYSILRALTAVTTFKQVKLRDLTYGTLLEFGLDVVYDALEAAGHDDLRIGNYGGLLQVAAKRWGHPIT